jgi:hypothetical protein
MKRSKSPISNQKLLSLLALSTGVLALPQTGEGAIIDSGVINAKVGFSSGFNASFTLDVPGTHDLQLVRHSSSAGTFLSVTLTHRVDFKALDAYAAIRAYSVGSRLFAKRANAGATWNGVGTQIKSGGLMDKRFTHFSSYSPVAGGVYLPASFTDKYVAFRFQDSTAGNATRYGWALLSMDVEPFSFPANLGTGPDVTLERWAFDTTGAKIPMGAIPEPTSAAMVVFGALALGATGVRRWRAGKKAQS